MLAYNEYALFFRHPVIVKKTPYDNFPSSAPVLMDDLKCLGTETDIANCRFNGWGVSDCTYQESISISCGECFCTVRI